MSILVRRPGWLMTLTLVLAGHSVWGQEVEHLGPPREVHTPAIPPDLKVMPRDADWFVSLRVADIWRSKSATLLRRLPQGMAQCDDLIKSYGLSIAEIRRLTIFSHHSRLCCLVSLAGPADRQSLRASLCPKAGAKRLHGHTYYLNEQDWYSMAFLDDRTFLVGWPEDVEEMLNPSKESNEGPVDVALWEADKHHFVAACFERRLKELKERQERGVQFVLPGAAELAPLLQARRMMLLGDFRAAELRLSFRVAFAEKGKAKTGRTAVRFLQKLLPEYIPNWSSPGEWFGGKDSAEKQLVGATAQFEEALKLGLKKLAIERKGLVVKGCLHARCRDAGVVLPIALLDMAFGSGDVHSAADESSLRLLSKAMLDYHQAHGRLPPAVLRGKDGKPLLSWRVAVLPYLGEEELFKQFKLDEPWDGPHNKTLITRMPKVFCSYRIPENADEQIPPTTGYQVFTGPGMLFDGRRGMRLADVKDGAEQTILLAETTRLVPWTKPEDMPIGANKPLPKLGKTTNMPGATIPIPQAILANGEVVTLYWGLSEAGSKYLRAMITPNGGDQADAETMLKRCRTIASGSPHSELPDEIKKQLGHETPPPQPVPTGANTPGEPTIKQTPERSTLPSKPMPPPE